MEVDVVVVVVVVDIDCVGVVDKKKVGEMKM